MPSAIATVVYCLLILGLFWLDRDQNARTSKALWIPVVWVSLACSRSPGQWLQMNAVPSPDQVLEGSPFDRLSYMFLLAAGLIVLVTRGRRIGRFLRANPIILLFFLYCAVSVLWSDYPDVAFKRWTKALGDLVMILVVLTDDDPSAAVKRLLTRTVFLLIPLSVLLVKYYPDLGRGYNRWTWTTYYTGVATGKNGLGYICMLFGLASLWCILETFSKDESDGRVRSLIVHGIVLAMALWLFRLADSVTSFACFLIGTVLIVATSPGRIRRRAASVHLVLAML